jgi:carboxypeptidase family protein
MATTVLQARAALLALLLCCGCGPDRREDPNMNADPNPGLRSDPRMYKINSVMGEVTAGGQPIPGATVTVVQTDEKIAVSESGTYAVVLDPVRLGTDTHELLFAAPGHKDQRRKVTVPANNRVRLDVELEPLRR